MRPRGSSAAGDSARGPASSRTDLRSAPLPEIGPDDRVRGPEGAPLLIVYADFECPFCAALELRLRVEPVRVCFRHFPVRGNHPRSWPAAAAAEAAAAQGAFWEMHDALFADQGRLEDPHLWARASSLGLDLGRFDADRRSDAVLARIDADFRGGIRAGAVATPTVFAFGERWDGRPPAEFWARVNDGH